jgi:hypothetical protein
VRALVERLAGHLGQGESSRTAVLTELRWRIRRAQRLTSSPGRYVLSLERGDDQATVLVDLEGEGAGARVRLGRVTSSHGEYVRHVAHRWLMDHELDVLEACGQLPGLEAP